MIIGVLMLTSLIFSFLYNDGNSSSIIISGGITILCGMLLYAFTRRADLQEASKQDGFVIVSATWVVISLFGSLPFIISGSVDNFTDAFFETMSGFTTTGATILSDIETIDKSILYWRSLTQWIGGMGIIVLSLAILPILGIGGMQLFMAEVPGPTKEKLHPRITETAKLLWGIYVLLTAVQTILLFAGGMSFYEALCHSFTTMSTGGFSTQTESLAAFSPYIQYVTIFFMFLAGTSFIVLYYGMHLRIKKMIESEEFRAYFFVIAIAAIFITGSLILTTELHLGRAFREALFQTVSIVTTTGFITADYMQWPSFLWFLVFLLMFTGGCAGSTGGGIKIVRQLLLFKNSRLELRRIMHPQAIVPVRLNGKVIPEKIIYNVLAFFIIYILIFVFASLFMSLLGLDFETAIGSVAASIGNIGPGIGKVGPIYNYGFIPDAGKWMLAFVMLMGRLELFTVLVLFSFTFWKK